MERLRRTGPGGAGASVRHMINAGWFTFVALWTTNVHHLAADASRAGAWGRDSLAFGSLLPSPASEREPGRPASRRAGDAATTASREQEECLAHRALSACAAGRRRRPSRRQPSPPATSHRVLGRA